MSLTLPHNWAHYLSALVLVMIRVSGLMVFAPIFSSTAIPVRIKAVFTLAITVCIAPVVAGFPMAHAQLGPIEVLSEIAVGLLFGLCLSFLMEMLTFAGDILGVAFSFSLVNLLDPNSSIETPLMGQYFTLLGSLVLLSTGLDRVMIAALMRSFAVVPVGAFILTAHTAWAVVGMATGIFLAALQLAAPVMVATMMVDFAVGLAARLSPQLPALSLTVPVKTMLGFLVLIGSLALWPEFIQARFNGLLNSVAIFLHASGAANLSHGVGS